METGILDILEKALEHNASDVLLTAHTPPVLRINGELRPFERGELAPKQIRELVYKILTNEEVVEFEREKELDFSVSLAGKYRFRGNLFLQRGSMGASFRLIPGRIPSFDELGLPPILKEISLMQKGLILISGPTGHGKSTTQAAIVDYINHHQRRHIITIENPVEFVHKNKKSFIEQREVGFDTNSFASALRHVLRQDPDVIQIGEIRDLESIATALTAAETGHLVITTLHTNDAAQSMDRIMDVFPPHQQGQIKIQLSFTLLAVISQMLLPAKDSGERVLATEVMRNTSAVANLIREGKTHQLKGVMETQSGIGMHTLESSIKKLYQKGIISRKEALAHIPESHLE